MTGVSRFGEERTSWKLVIMLSYDNEGAPLLINTAAIQRKKACHQHLWKC